MPKPKSPTLALKRLLRVLTECLPTIEAAIERDRQFTALQKQQAAKPFRDSYNFQNANIGHTGETTWGTVGMPIAAPIRHSDASLEQTDIPEPTRNKNGWHEALEASNAEEQKQFEEHFHAPETVAFRETLEQTGAAGANGSLDPWDNDALLAQKLMKG